MVWSLIIVNRILLLDNFLLCRCLSYSPSKRSVTSSPPPTMAHEGAYIRDENKSIKMTFKYAGIIKGCAGCIYRKRI